MIVEVKEPWYDSPVFCDGVQLDAESSKRVWDHSYGFAWGYGGSGPAQLALAILLAAGVPDETAVAHHQSFKWEFIAPLPTKEPWAFEVDVDEWLAGRRS